MIVAVVPVKALDVAKSRLAPYIPQGERARIVIKLAERAVHAIRETDLVWDVAVATPDAGTASLLNARHLPDTGGLNGTLHSAAAWAESLAADGLLVVPCDLPAVTAADIIYVLTRGAGMTIARTHDGGTGALYLAPPRSIPPEFGEGSYARHLRSARERGVPVHEVDRPGFRYDLDTPGDLERFSDLLQAG